ncbi:YjbH domain-containing protein [Paracoccus sp. JM45]|uniref:YjbH domain-containing protein n=1 Tax=Paracoccus sp. JM45 TaxID=2283626 RepID=UPI000E6C7686|nr:YjbH domain-containing protein [Paracoccus sp. JM45]RJE81686.1 YjbH domain-containing protein [Paracoccus sp. JM45]
MRRSRLTSQLMATTLPVALVVGAGYAIADPMLARNMSTYGMPGGIDTPTAEALPEGTLAATVSQSDYALRSNLVFQPLPKLTTAFRYSRVEGINDYRNDGFIYDRSFDLRYQIVDQDGWRPAVSVGVQDFLGTGVYSGEYIVATRDITPTIRASVGLGWGTLAGKPRVIDATSEGGTSNIDDWFSGGAKPFASVNWQVNDKLSLTAEYSNDIYRSTYSLSNGGTISYQQGNEEPGNLNFGANYKFGRTYEVGVYTIGTETIGAQFTVALNHRDAAYPSGLESAPAPVRPRPSRDADPEGWSGQWSQDPTAQPAIQKVLANALKDEGQLLESMSLTATRAEVRIRNQRYIQQSQAIGRAARLMTRALPPSVETFVITSSADGVAASSVTLRRSDVERLENTEAGKIAAVSALSDAPLRQGDLTPTEDLFPRLQWNIGPYLDISLFDADEPARYEVGAEASGSYEIVPGLVLSGTLRQRAFGNQEQSGPSIDAEDNDGVRGENYTAEEYLADPSLETTSEGVPRVRSDARMYTGNTSPTIPELTAAWFARPTEQIYSRVTVGLLEEAYGGVSAEVLWKPANSPLAFGAEVNRVRKRDFDMLLDFRDYEVTTGFLSAYYEFSQGFTAQLDVGQYLAGDKGATFTLTREFENGWRVGAYATKTDLSAEEFGEGSFDKGITLSIPIGWATGNATRDRASTTIKSLSRDGGAKLEVNDRLYDKVRDSQTVKLYQGWGSFWR